MSINKNCETLDEFWSAISPIGDMFGDHPSGFLRNFVFRGQSDAGWELVPKIYRTCVLSKIKLGVLDCISENSGHFHLEWHLLDSFMHFCDLNGLVIPNDSTQFRTNFSWETMQRRHVIQTHGWPDEWVIPLMALAQHHGLPTRLLDWTSSPYVAAYFAAEAAIMRVEQSPSARLAVFGMDINSIRLIDGLKRVTIPGSTSPNAAPQGSSFILVENSGYLGEPFAPDVSLESKLGLHEKALRKITLPLKDAPTLMRRLSKFGFSAATIFPGYDGSARAVLEERAALYTT